MEKETNQKNYVRPTEGKTKVFIWRVKDNRIMKWYINRTVTNGTGEIKVMFNIDGLILRKLEMKDYLKEKKNKLYG